MARRIANLDPAAVALGNRIVTARDAIRLTQEDLAVILGVTRGAVAQWEMGATVPKPARFKRLAETLRVTERWLLSGLDNEPVPQPATRAEADALAVLQSLPVESQAAALAILRAFRDSIAKK